MVMLVRLYCDFRRIILNNPKKRNALSFAMLTSLQENILTGIDDKDLRVIIISAQGPVFSSGHDLKELTSEQGRDYHSRVFRTCSEVMTLIQDLPVPVIAMEWPLEEAVPRKVAMEMLFTGRPITAQEALLHGLVSKVVREECLEEETLAIARRICESSRPVVALGKAAFQRQMAQSRDAAYATATAVMVDNLALYDGQEGIQAFLEKRRPLWTNSTERAHD
ncbi:hypothetical protein QTP70_025431 [Hemibagrus guttatus]|uniref:Enoyl-CoA hydratase domain-containing protein 3, mitochondrial n=1 Tax=Hemibagrus guttatus TaxID=175788 RepID=A0AAE0QNZ9_9TELE|nr:hypothetical protein QTP70_025431 [Hemibagrus guttatus]